MSNLIYKRRLGEVLKTKFTLGIGKIIEKLKYSNEFYKDATVNGYEEQNKRLSDNGINKINDYVKLHLPEYKNEQEERDYDIKDYSQYFPYLKIKSPAKVLNIGCFYCRAENEFLKLNKNNMVYGLDFGNIKELNKKFLNKRLVLFEGYPLDSLDLIKDVSFDYTLFVRTGVLMNINELLSYMEKVSKISKNVMFLEVFKPVTYKKRVLDVNKIDMMNPIKMYSGMYIHNYPEILKKFGYKVIESEILNSERFKNKHTANHKYIWVYGTKQKI